MALLNLKANRNSVLALIIVASAIFVGSAAAGIFAYQKLSDLNNEFSQKDKAISEAKETVRKLDTSKLQYEDAQTQMACLESTVSTQAYVPTLLRQLENLGKSVNLDVIAVRPQKNKKQSSGPRKMTSSKDASEGKMDKAEEGKGSSTAKKSSAKPYDELNIEIELAGKYMNVLDFLYKLTSFPKIIAVNSVEMDPANNKDLGMHSPILNVKIKLTAFVYKESESAAITGPSVKELEAGGKS